MKKIRNPNLEIRNKRTGKIGKFGKRFRCALIPFHLFHAIWIWTSLPDWVPVGGFRVARSSRVLVFGVPPKRTSLPRHCERRERNLQRRVLKVHEGGTPWPTLGTSVLPGVLRPRACQNAASHRLPVFSAGGGRAARRRRSSAGRARRVRGRRRLPGPLRLHPRTQDRRRRIRQAGCS